MQRARTAAALVLVSLMIIAVPVTTAARASQLSGRAIVKLCEKNGYRLPGNYSVQELQRAFNSISPTEREYTTCAQVISNKLNAELTGAKLAKGSGANSSSGGFPVLLVAIIVIVLLGGAGAFYSYRRGSDIS